MVQAKEVLRKFSFTDNDCDDTMFRCDDRMCIDKWYVCDDTVDCMDGRDEKDCGRCGKSLDFNSTGPYSINTEENFSYCRKVPYSGFRGFWVWGFQILKEASSPRTGPATPFILV